MGLIVRMAQGYSGLRTLGNFRLFGAIRYGLLQIIFTSSIAFSTPRKKSILKFSLRQHWDCRGIVSIMVSHGLGDFSGVKSCSALIIFFPF